MPNLQSSIGRVRFIGFIAALVPFGPFLIDGRLARDEARQEAEGSCG